MKERKIRIILILMSIAFLALIAVQAYWVTTAFELEKQQFASTVTKVLTGVSEKVDKIEAKDQVVKILKQKNNNMFFKSDSLIGFNVFFDDHPQNIDEEQNGMKYEVRTEHNGKTVQTQSQHNWLYLDDNKSDTIIKQFSYKTRLDSFTREKQHFVDNVVSELILVSAYGDIENRVSRNKLDSLLSNEFKNSGINTQYFFGIEQTGTDSIKYTTTVDLMSEIKESKFRAQLFPQEFFSKPNYLKVYFPKEDTYVLSTMWGMLVLSAGIIITIIFIFLKTVQLLIKQKKITEIKNDLINNITHEFKTPISTISLACESLDEPVFAGNPEINKKYHGMIKEENNRLRMLVENLLNTAALEKGDYDLKIKPIDLHSIINNSSKNFFVSVEKRNGKIVKELGAKNFNIYADQFHLTNIINNLLDNANKYTDKDPEIFIKTSDSEDGIVLSIEDNGIGIANDQMEKIFDTFYRVPKGNVHNVRGNGIGLSYVKKLVEAHQGKIEVVSKINEGSKFLIYLPAMQNG